MKTKTSLATLLLLGAGFIGGYGYGRWYGPRPASPGVAAVQTSARYHCPMHPDQTSDKPGDCPICGMKLVPIEAAMTPEPRAVTYHCPMHPNYTSDKPGDCPICGMKLVPRETSAPTGHAGDHAMEGMASTAPEDAIRISTRKQQLIGVTLGTAETTSSVQTVRSVGKVDVDERRIVKVQTRIDGWIQQVLVDFTGTVVEKGQALLTIYSPELVATQQEYLLTLRHRDVMRTNPLSGSLPRGESLVAAARRRLELFELTDGDIEEIGRSGKVINSVTVYSPFRGVVLKRNAFPKQRVSPETELYSIADLDRVWVMADVYESDAPVVHLGMPVRVLLPYSGQRLSGRVDFVQPTLDPMTRTLKVRIDAANPRLTLKPEMFVDVEFEIARPARVTVPVEAVLDSGTRKTVFVDRGNGYFEPRQVETGEQVGERIEIVRGLAAGERIVTSGNFLIDSESQMKSAGSAMTGHSHESGHPAAKGEPR
jgi:membrane fusion protein, copper/silver efflux system